MAVWCSKRRKLPLFLTVSFFSILVVPLSLNAVGETANIRTTDAKEGLQKAEVLLTEGKLDEAINALVQVARRDPEQMERVQILILAIRQYRERINAKLAQLNEAIEDGDEETVSQLIFEIKEIDKDPNKGTLQNLILAAVIVSKAKNDTIANEFFKEGNALLSQGAYREAVGVYRKGFLSEAYLEFYDDYIQLARDRSEIVKYLEDKARQEKIWEAYSTIAVDGSKIIDEINASLDIWDNNAAELEDLSASIVLETSPSEWLSVLSAVTDAMSTSSTDGGTTQEEAVRLNNTRRNLYLALDGLPEDFRYERILDFLSGREKSRIPEGIILAQQRFLVAVPTTELQKIFKILLTLMETSNSAYRTEQWDQAENSFLEAQNAERIAYDFLSRSEQLFENLDFSGDGKSTEILQDIKAYFLTVRDAIAAWQTLIDLGRTVPLLPDFNEVSPSVELVSQIETPILNAVSIVERLKEEWDASFSALSLLPGIDHPEVLAVNLTLRADIANALNDYKNRRLTLLASAANFLYENLENRTRTSMNSNLEEIQNFVEGIETSAIAEDSIPERRPNYALENLLIPALDSVAVARNDVASFLGVLDILLDRDPPVDNADVIADYQVQGEVLLLELSSHNEKLDDLDSRAKNYVNTARRAVSVANNGLAQARRDLQLAQTANNAGQRTQDIEQYYRAIDLYKSSEESLDQVDEEYFQILINDIDIARGSGIDAARSALRNQIRNERNRLAVTVKQNTIREAGEAYGEGEYSVGLINLNQSQEFWNRSFGEDDPELTAWINRLRNAQESLQQTILDPFDPLYSEMNQYLNLANKYYGDGVFIANQNRQDADAIRAFQSANNLLRQVLNTFPGNEAALFLEQRILRETDRETWAKNSVDLVNESRRAIRANNIVELRGNNRKKGLYVQLLVLEKIEAEFPSLEGTIYDAEVVLGIIIPPPDLSVLAESRRLVAEAQQVWVNLGGNGSERALRLLDQALFTWLDNQEASQLKNEILLSTEPDRLPGLPPELLNLLNFVTDYYAQGNTILAQAFINRIISEYPQHRNDPRVKEWQNKVDARQ